MKHNSALFLFDLWFVLETEANYLTFVIIFVVVIFFHNSNFCQSSVDFTLLYVIFFSYALRPSSKNDSDIIKKQEFLNLRKRNF